MSVYVLIYVHNTYNTSGTEQKRPRQVAQAACEHGDWWTGEPAQPSPWKWATDQCVCVNRQFLEIPMLKFKKAWKH